MVLPQARYGEVPVYHFIAPQGAEAKADAEVGTKGKLSAFFLYNHEEYMNNGADYAAKHEPQGYLLKAQEQPGGYCQLIIPAPHCSAV